MKFSTKRADETLEFKDFAKSSDGLFLNFAESSCKKDEATAYKTVQRQLKKEGESLLVSTSNKQWISLEKLYQYDAKIVEFLKEMWISLMEPPALSQILEIPGSTPPPRALVPYFQATAVEAETYEQSYQRAIQAFDAMLGQNSKTFAQLYWSEFKSAEYLSGLKAQPLKTMFVISMGFNKDFELPEIKLPTSKEEQLNLNRVMSQIKNFGEGLSKQKIDPKYYDIQSFFKAGVSQQERLVKMFSETLETNPNNNPKPKNGLEDVVIQAVLKPVIEATLNISEQDPRFHAAMNFMYEHHKEFKALTELFNLAVEYAGCDKEAAAKVTEARNGLNRRYEISYAANTQSQCAYNRY